MPMAFKCAAVSRWACRKRRRRRVCGCAVAAGRAGLVNQDNKTALLLACAHGHEETVRMLVAPTKATGALDVVGNTAKVLVNRWIQR